MGDRFCLLSAQHGQFVVMLSGRFAGFPAHGRGNPWRSSVGTQWETRGKTQRYTLKTKTSPQKKVLSLVLCVAMLLSVMVMGTGAAFTDEDDFSPQYAEAAEVLTGMKVMQGYEDGSYFLPQRNITRAQVATMIYRAATGDVNDTQVGQYVDYDQFNDVSATDWHAGYVNYCANAELIKGFTPDTFGPNKNVTGYQVLAMILRAVGYDQNDEFTGSGWEIRTASIAESLGILDNVQDATLGQPATRELVAELIFQAMIVPTVEYTVAFGYQPVWPRETLGEREFGLEQISGEITAVGRTAGTTEFIQDNGAKNTVANTDTAWTDIGYGAYVWTVDTAGAKTRTAVSDVTITGESLAVSTDGTMWTDVDADVDAVDGYNVYYNGKLVGGNLKDIPADTNVTGEVDTAAEALSIVGQRGVKVDFIDNDNSGRAEAVVVTEYTVANVSAITTADSTSGTQGVKETTTYLNNGTNRVAVKDSALVTNDSLAVGDWVTYVEYAGDYYVTEAPATAATFTNRNVSANADTTYTIGGNNYYISDLEYVTDRTVGNGLATNYLENSKYRNTDVNIYTDAYGYIVYVERQVNPVSYLYVLSNEPTNANTKLTESVVAFTDGTIATVQIEGESVGHNALADKMYTYTGSDGTYDLDKLQTEMTNGNYTNGTATIKGTVNGQSVSKAVDTATVVVDLRDYTVGDTSADVFTGYSEIPTVQNAQLWFADRYNGLGTGRTITYAFLLDNNNDVEKDFIVYQTTDYSDEVDSRTGNIVAYYMDVVIDGAIVEDYELTPEQFNKVQTYGVGLYSFTNDTLTDYSAFNEVDGITSSWQNGRISVKYDNGQFGGSDALVNYTYTNENQITVLDIGSGIIDFNMLSGKSFHVYVVADGSVAEHIYVIVDKDNAITSHQVTYEKNGYTYTYEVSKNNSGDDLTECVSRTNIPTNTLYSVEVLGETVDATGKGSGTQADPFTYVARICEEKTTGTSPRLYVKDNARNAQLELWDGNVANQVGDKTGIGDITDTGTTVGATTVWMLKSGDTWYRISVELLSHDTTVTSNDATQVVVSGNTVTVNSTSGLGSTNTTLEALKDVLVPADGAVLTSYDYDSDKGTGTLVVTAECGDTASYVVTFIEKQP